MNKILEILFDNERIAEADIFMELNPKASMDDVLQKVYPELYTEFISNECAKKNKDFLTEIFKVFNPKEFKIMLAEE